jgi:acetoin utilization protein AcuB
MKPRKRQLSSSLTAGDVMTRRPAVLEENATVRDAVELLQRVDVRHVPVVSETREVIGMVSDRDLRGLPLVNVTADLPPLPPEAPIGQVMSSDVITVQPETDLREVIDLLLDHKIGAVPVVDAEGGLVGIVSYVDLLRVLDLVQELEAQP